MAKQADIDFLCTNIPGCSAADVYRLPPASPYKLLEALNRGFRVMRNGHVWLFEHPADKNVRTLATDAGLAYINRTDFRL